MIKCCVVSTCLCSSFQTALCYWGKWTFGLKYELLLWLSDFCLSAEHKVTDRLTGRHFSSDLHMSHQLQHVITQKTWHAVILSEIKWMFYIRLNIHVMYLTTWNMWILHLCFHRAAQTNPAEILQSALPLSSSEAVWQLAATQLWPLTLIEWPAAVSAVSPAVGGEICWQVMASFFI